MTQTTTIDIDQQIKKFKIPPVFSYFACAGDPEYKSLTGDAKEAAHLEVCKHFKVKPNAVIGIDDSDMGVQAARSVGMFTIGVSPSPINCIRADLNVHPDLGSLARDDVVKALMEEFPQQSLQVIREPNWDSVLYSKIKQMYEQTFDYSQYLQTPIDK